MATKKKNETKKPVKKNKIESTDNQPEKKEHYNLLSFDDISDMFRRRLTDEEIRQNIISFLKKRIFSRLEESYTVVFLYNEYGNFSSFETNKIYENVSAQTEKRDILLVLNSSGGYPALGLGHSLDYLARLVSKYPKSHEMFSGYLSCQLDLQNVGYLERLAESTVQYGERLIGTKKLPNNASAHNVAHKLVYEYKDHSFVIDIDEARSLLGEDIRLVA